MGFWYALASVLAEVLVRFTAERQTEALASFKVEEGAFRAFLFVIARYALAALFAPFHSVGAFAHNDEFTINQRFDFWHSFTYAKALAVVPHKIFRTRLFEAFALALIYNPLKAIDAWYRLTYVPALSEIRIPDHLMTLGFSV